MIRRTISWRVLVISVAVAIGAAGSMYLLHSWQLSRLSKSLLELAQSREAEQKWHEAAAYLDRYLRIHPKEAAVRGRLAATYARGAATPAAVAAAVDLHYRAIAADPAKPDAIELRSRLARLLVESRRYLDAEREARTVIESEVDNAEACRALALAQFSQWENGALAAEKLEGLKLLTSVEQARRVNPADALLAEIAARLYRNYATVIAAEYPEMSESDRHDRADGCLDQLVAQNDQDPRAYLARFRYRVRYELSGTAEDIASAIELAPTDTEVLLTAAKSAQRDALLAKDANEQSAAVHYQRARDLYQQLVADKSSHPLPEAYLGLGDVQVALGDLDQAVSAWRAGLKRFAAPTIQVTFHARIADTLIQADRGSEARETLKAIDNLVGSLDSSVPRDMRLSIAQSQDLRKATWHIQRNEAALAIPLLHEVVARQATGTNGNLMAAAGWNHLGRANALMGEWGEAAVAFDRAAPLEPNSHAIRLAAAVAWLQVGRVDLAVQRAEQSLAIRPTADGMVLLATAELDRQRALPRAQRSLDRLERTLIALENDPAVAASVSAPWRIDLLRADFAMLRGLQASDEVDGRNQAVAVIKRAEMKYADRSEYWRLASLAYQRLNARSDAEQAISRYAALTQSVADLAILKSQIAVLRGDVALAQQVLEEAAPKAASNEQSKLRHEMASLSLAKGDVALAERLLAIEVRDRPNDISILRRLCEFALQRKDSTAAAQWKQKLAAAGPIGAWWSRYFSAAQLVAAVEGPQDPRLREASEEVTKLIVIRPHWPMVHSLRAMIEQRQGRLEEAANAFEHAIQLGERRFSIFEQLVALLDRLNRTADAERYLSRLESQMPFSQRLTEIAANYELRRDQPEQAIQIARASVAKRPADAYAHLWLARLLLANKQLVEAETEFRKTLELAPNDIRAWNGLFSFHVRAGNLQQARQTLEELREKADLAVSDRSFVLAQGYEMLGDWKNAEGQYEAATVATPNRGDVHIRLAMVHLRTDPKKAEQSLRRALELDSGSATARRMLAALLATRGDPKQLEEAETLLRQPDPTTANILVEDRRLNALLLAQYGDVRQIDRAVEILEEVIAKPTESVPGDRLILARVYESQARRSPDPSEAEVKRNAAKQHLLTVANQTSAQPAHLVALIEFLLRNNQAAEAANWLDKLEALVGSQSRSDPATIAQLIELRMRHGSNDRSVKWLEQLSATDSDPLRPIAMQAAWLASQGRTSEIDALVEPAGKRIVAAAGDEPERGRRARLMGDLYWTTKLPAQAERWYRTAVSHDPAQFPAQVRALVLNDQVTEAIQICREKTKGDQTAHAAIVLASALTEATTFGEKNEAADAFLKSALDAHADDTKLLYAVGTLRAVQGRFDEATRLYRLVLEVEPKNIAALNNLAMMLAESPAGYVESLKLITQAIDIAGQHPGLLDTKGTILLYQGKAKEALFLLEAAAREAGQDARHRFHLAAAYHGAGDVLRAKQQLELAIDLNLDKQVLTPTDRRMLAELKTALLP